MAAGQYITAARAYMRDVKSGKVPACHWVKAAVARQARELRKPPRGYRFDQGKAERVCKFIEALPHIKGVWANRRERIKLEPWQCFILTTVFGWVETATGLRRFRTVYIEIPRKNAKSTITGGVALYMLGADGEQGAEVYAAGTTKEQARIVWGDARSMVLKQPDLQADLGIVAAAHAIYQPATSSTFKALSRDQDGNLDGLNVHFAAVDELHGHKDRGVWDVLATGTGARSQPIIWAITTAGFNQAGICYEQRTYVTKILDQVIEDDRYFGIIYTIDEGDRWDAPTTWRKANPNWGISVRPESIESMARRAMQMAAAQNNFLTKHLDVWVNADVSWMSMPAWNKCADPTLDETAFEGDRCFITLDLATKTDLAAKMKLFVRDVEGADGKAVTHYFAFGRYYLPEEAAEDGRNAQYAGWAAQDLVVLTPGNVTDFSYIEEDLRQDHVMFTAIQDVAYDPWQAAQLSQRMAAEGMTMVEFRQTVQNMSEPMKELEKLVLQGLLHHNGDPVLAWMMSNVVAHLDAKENIYPRKDRPENKIDGAVALIMAIGRAITFEDGMTLGDDYELLTV